MSAKVRKILVADDEESLRMILGETLEAEGYRVQTARDGNEALALIGRERFDIVLTDIRMPGMSGMQLLAEVKRLHPRIHVIIMTSHASLESSIEAIRHGAYDYLLKPFPDLGFVVQMVGRAAEQVRLVEENEELIRSLRTANAQLSESNELLASRASTIATLLDYSQSISGLLAPQQFADETARASSKLAGGRPAVVYRVNRAPLEIVPVAAEGIARETIEVVSGPKTDGETAVQAWIGQLVEANELPRRMQPPHASAYLKPIVAGGAVGTLVAVFEAAGPFPPSVRAVLDKFMHQVRQTAENVALHESMRGLAIRDGLTGLYNHRYFQDRFHEEFSRAKRHKHALSLVFIDVDHFKKFNDAHGHPKGDALLRALSRLIRSTGRLSDIPARATASTTNVTALPSRESDIVARYGGEEFVVILTETEMQGALIRAERLRKMIADSGFVFDKGEPLHVTVSVGVASLTAEHEKPEHLIQEADQAMYAAKRGGRNRVCTTADAAGEASR